MHCKGLKTNYLDTLISNIQSKKTEMILVQISHYSKTLNLTQNEPKVHDITLIENVHFASFILNTNKIRE